MPDLVLLNNVEHQDLRVITDRAAQYGDAVRQCITFTFEFRAVQAHYPILFQTNAAGSFDPVALFGFVDGENLFLDESGWDARYIPAMMKREPFLIGFQESKDPSQPERIRVLSLDREHPRVSTTMGEPLFQPLGGRTEFLDTAADILETIYAGIEHNKAFTAALIEQELLEAITIEVALSDGTRNQLLGYHGIVEEKVTALPADVLKRFADRGFLMPLFMALASTSNIQVLVDRKNRSVADETS